MRFHIRVPQPKPTQPNSPKLLAKLVLAIGLAALVGGQFGCSKIAGPPPCVGDNCDPPPPPEYPVRISPIKAVEYLQLAWQDRDSVRADSVLNVEYQGTSAEIGTTNPGTLSFVKSDEIRALHNLKENPDVSKLEMTFPPQASWILDQYLGDPLDWVVVKVNGPSIKLTESDGDILTVSPSNTTFEFKARPITSGAQTLWEVVRWLEVHNSPE